MNLILKTELVKLMKLNVLDIWNYSNKLLINIKKLVSKNSNLFINPL